jgi:predicted PurR-regulated permease PerM
MYISVNDLLIFLAVFIVVCFVATTCVILIIALVRLNRLLKRAGKLLDDNSENIDKTMKKVPVLMEQWDETGESLMLVANKAEATIDAVGGLLTGESAAGGETSTVQSIVTIAESVLQIVLGYFAKKE